jgi:hypothetical protein
MNLQINKEESKKTSNEKQYKYATLAKASYDRYYTNVPKTKIELASHLPNFEVIEDLTDPNSTVLYNNGTNDLVISYRGTDPTNLKDIVADTQILLGTPIENLTSSCYGRFCEAEQKYIRAKERFPKANISTTGHSLGGKLGLYVAKKNDLEANVFNVGSSPFDAFFESNTSTNKKPINIYHTAGDAISMSNRFLGKNENIKTIEPHDFLPTIAGVAALSSLAFGTLSAPLAASVGIGALTYATLNKFHSLANFLPEENFIMRDNIDKNKAIIKDDKNINSDWLYPITDTIASNQSRPLVKFNKQKNNLPSKDIGKRVNLRKLHGFYYNNNGELRR